jgi:hypothetical protein
MIPASLPKKNLTQSMKETSKATLRESMIRKIRAREEEARGE